MKVVALQTWSNGSFSMDEKTVADIPDDLAAELIAKGICADASSYFGGGGAPLMYANNGTLQSGTYLINPETLLATTSADKDLIYNALKSGQPVLLVDGSYNPLANIVSLYQNSGEWRVDVLYKGAVVYIKVCNA